MRKIYDCLNRCRQNSIMFTFIIPDFKNLSKLDIEGNFLSIILNYEILNAFPKSNNNTRISALTASIRHTGASSQYNRQEKEIKA